MIIIKGVLTLKQIVHVIRKADVEKEYVKILRLELDYELATLYDAMENDNDKERQKSKKRLYEIHQELEKYNGFI